MGTLVAPDELRPWVAGIDVATASGAASVDVPDHATTLVVRTTSDARREVSMIRSGRWRARSPIGELMTT